MRIRYENKNESPITFILEPWAEEFVVPPQGEVIVEITSKAEADEEQLEVHSFSQTCVVVWLWRTCTARVFINGVDKTLVSGELPAPG